MYQEENGMADKLRRFRVCGDVSKQVGMSSGAFKNYIYSHVYTAYLNAKTKNSLDFLFHKVSFERGGLSTEARLSDRVNVSVRIRASTNRRNDCDIPLQSLA